MEKITESNIKLEDQKTYELGYLLSPLIPEETSEEASQAMIQKIIVGQGVEVISQQNPKIKDLAYPLSKTVGGQKNKFKQAYLGVVKFKTEPSKVILIKNLLDKEENVIRFLLIIAPKKSEKTPAPRRGFGAKTVSTEKDNADSVKPEMSAEEIDKEIDDLITDPVV